MKINKILPEKSLNNLWIKIKELTQKVDQCFQSVSNGKALVASAITDKKVATDATATFEEMANNIASLKLGSGNATAGDVLSGKTFTNSDGIEYTGEMPNNSNGTKGSSMGKDENGVWVYFPYGYYPNYGNTGNGYIYLNSDNIGNAAAADVLSGKTFTSANGVKVTGTMTNQGAKTASLNCGGSYTIPAGYHNGSGKVTANSLASQTSATAAAAQITKGYTAWVNGVKITGTRVNPGLVQSGYFDITVPAHSSTSKIVTFSTPYEVTPTVTWGKTLVSNVEAGYINNVSVSYSANKNQISFSFGSKSTDHNLVVRITWEARGS